MTPIHIAVDTTTHALGTVQILRSREQPAYSPAGELDSVARANSTLTPSQLPSYGIIITTENSSIFDKACVIYENSDIHPDLHFHWSCDS